MPKMKTNKGAAKRFKVTGSGKIKRSRAFTSHMFSNKSQKQKRKLRKAAIMTAGDYSRTRRMLGL
ncbi:50S ribosomal protein L35 [Caldalkalibacillus mannanilyticus]|uniref:50S ribosomal protein L35 n=1 Tax=Caldalkalibacillus mannanilyticus TaxID=1418 RepID=UPI00046AB301|nr:50S ribosomal protein L35 [Caldalkalibacillus mannanilyticus]